MDTGNLRFLLALFSMVVCLDVPGISQDFERTITDETLRELYKGRYSSATTINKSYEGIKGSPFLIDEWQKGSFILLDSTMYSNLDLKYDMYNEMLIVKDTRTGNPIAPEPAIIRSFTFNGRNFINVSVPEFEGNNKILFWEIIYQGESMLGRHINKYLKRGDYEVASAADKPYDELIESKPLFIYLNRSNEIMVFKKNKKSILKAFSASQKAEEYLKSEKLSMKKEEDIIQLVTYLDTIK